MKMRSGKRMNAIAMLHLLGHCVADAEMPKTSPNPWLLNARGEEQT
jgi:hypothetical protein